MFVLLDENKPPVARAGGDKIVELVSPFISLDGSGSTDDKAIISYVWARQDNSLAAGVSCLFSSLFRSHSVPQFQTRQM